jgi:hypothetical protein
MWVKTRQFVAFFAVFGIYLGIFGIYSSAAQSGGQFCVRSFLDNNGNGIYDAESEQPLTRGIGVELLDNDNVVIASAVLDRSPNAVDGVICFQNLPDGDYSVVMSSADFTATTQRLIQRTVSETGLPVVIEFGAQRITDGAGAAPVTSADTTPGTLSDTEMQSLITRLAFSTVGTVLVLVLMLIIGVAIYATRMRRVRGATQPISYRPDSVRNFDPYDVGPPAGMPPASTLEDTGRSAPISLDDTDRSRPVNPDI